MKLLPIIFSIILLISISQSCSTSRQIPNNLVDTYYGFLPCADCPGISYTLELKKNGQFKLTRDYYDRDVTSTSAGKFTFKDGRLNLYTEEKNTERYEVDGDKLFFLDADGNRIMSELAPYYTLYKGDASKAQMPKNFGKSSDGLIYKGTGNEPFWMVQITENNTIYFKGLIDGEQEFEVQIINTRLADDNQSIIYTGSDKSHKLVVHVKNNLCQDDMSGQYSNTALKVEYMVNGQKQQLNGCGNYQNKYQLNGIWTMEQMDGHGIDSPDSPTMSIHLPDGRITGTTGCNRYFGSIKNTTEDSIKFDKIGATKRACPDMSLEDKFLKILNQEDLIWEIDEQGRLHIRSHMGDFVLSRTEN